MAALMPIRVLRLVTGNCMTLLYVRPSIAAVFSEMPERFDVGNETALDREQKGLATSAFRAKARTGMEIDNDAYIKVCF